MGLVRITSKNTQVFLGMTFSKSAYLKKIGQAQRGGLVTSHIRLGKNVYAPISPLYSVDLVIGFEPLETHRNAIHFLKPGGVIIFNTAPVIPPSSYGKARIGYPSTDKMMAIIRKITEAVFLFDAMDLTSQAGNRITMNMVMLGVATAAGLPFYA